MAEGGTEVKCMSDILELLTLKLSLNINLFINKESTYAVRNFIDGIV